MKTKLSTAMALLLGYVCNAQLSVDSASMAKSLKNIPNFTINKDNYFITGCKLGKVPDAYSSDVKMQMSFKQRLLNKAMPYSTFLFFTYTQKSFWNIYQHSSPFGSTNYNPGLSIAKSIFYRNKFKGIFSMQVEHESNGLGGDNSRSWNFVSLSYFGLASNKFRYFIKSWFPFDYAENKDLPDYIGYTESRLTWVAKENKLSFDLVFRKAPALNWHGNMVLECSYRPFTLETFYLFAQYFEGYAETLLHYRASSSWVRVGIAFKPSYFLFY